MKEWMRSPRKVFSGLFVITIALVLHVHTQISIFQVSYSIQRKEKQLSALSDEFKIRNFEVSKLHSLNYLDKRKKELNLNLVMPKTIQVVSVPAEKEMSRVIDAPPLVQKSVFSFVNFIKEAQAKTASSSSSR